MIHICACWELCELGVVQKRTRMLWTDIQPEVQALARAGVPAAPSSRAVPPYKLRGTARPTPRPRSRRVQHSAQGTRWRWGRPAAGRQSGTGRATPPPGPRAGQPAPGRRPRPRLVRKCLVSFSNINTPSSTCTLVRKALPRTVWPTRPGGTTVASSGAARGRSSSSRLLTWARRPSRRPSRGAAAKPRRAGRSRPR